MLICLPHVISLSHFYIFLFMKLLSAIAGKDAIPPCSVFESVCAQRQALGSSVWKKIHLYFQGGVTLLGAEKWKGQNGIWPVMVWDLVKE